MIFSIATKRWQKMAMVVATVLLDNCEKLEGESDITISDRVRVLVDKGKLEARGNLSKMRNSEIRLKS